MIALLLILTGLLCLSGLFSSAETALFSLKRNERAQVGQRVTELLSNPGELLVSILLGNLVLNLLFFTMVARLFPDDEPWTQFVWGLGALLCVLVFGEILPKTLGLSLRIPIARFAAGPLVLWRWVLRPVSGSLTRILESSHDLISRWATDRRALTHETFSNLMDQSVRDASLVDAEAEILSEIVELGDIRVREIMTPRVDALFLEESGDNRDEVLPELLRRKQSWVPVIGETPDELLGKVRVRDLYRDADAPIAELVMPVKFVPEVANALDLLAELQEDRTSEAVVLDEWGGTAGYVTAEDVFEELVGDLRTEDEERQPAVVPLGEGRYRVRGNLSVRDWNQKFGLAIVPREFETVGGFVTMQLGRIPRAGDTVRADRLELEVHEVRGRRIQLVDIRYVAPMSTEEEA